MMKRRWFHGPNRRIVPPWIGFRRDGVILSLAGLAIALTLTAGIVYGTPHLRARYDCLYRQPGQATCRIYGRCDYYGLQGRLTLFGGQCARMVRLLPVDRDARSRFGMHD